MRVGFIGDTHGDLDFITRALAAIHEQDCREVIQVGDYGFIWPSKYSMTDQTDAIHKVLETYDMQLRYIAGNHDPWPYYNQIEHREHNITDRITYMKRGSMHQYDDGSVFVFLGGAPSIDYRGRVEGRSWWPEEEIREADVLECLRYKGLDIKVLVTHDAPVLPPGIHDVQDDPTFYYRAAGSRLALGRVMDELRPKYLIHGHYHMRYDKKAWAGEEQPLAEVQIIGLDCNYARFVDSWIVLEFDNGTFK